MTSFILFVCLMGGLCFGEGPIRVGSDRQLFVDDYLIDQLDHLQLKLHKPVPREIIFYFDKPWEGKICGCPVVIKEGDRYRMWYLARRTDSQGKVLHKYTGYAESFDGIHWVKPDLGLFEYEGSKHNNICITDPDVCGVCVFRDGNPEVDDEQRYKAIGVWSGGKPHRIYGMTSRDGIHWNKIPDPIVVAPAKDPGLDTHGIAFWDSLVKRYVIYHRGWFPEGDKTGWWREKHRPNKNRIRAVRMTTSKDFIHWSDWQYIDIGEDPWREHFYTNSAQIYYRAPVYLMFPRRFMPKRKFFEDWPNDGLSDVVFLASRDGVHWSRTFRQAYLRPGLDPLNWHDRCLYIASAVVPTGPSEMSMYVTQNYRTDNIHMQRFTLREDGFVSVNATWPKGVMMTRPLVFEGDRLEINYSTSAAGHIKIELCDENGHVLPGYEVDDDQVIFGDEIGRIVEWKNGADVSSLQGRAVRLRVEMLDADLYSFCFVKAN